MSREFASSDHHFGHKRIIELCDRPFASLNKMDNAMINLWNETVRPEDTVYYLGDFSLSDNFNYIRSKVEKLNGHKHLILGNHEKLDPWQYIKCGFDSVHTSLKVGDWYMIHDPAVKTALPKDSILLHGHVHCMWKSRPENKLINVGMDVWDYKPVSFEQIEEEIRSWK